VTKNWITATHEERYPEDYVPTEEEMEKGMRSIFRQAGFTDAEADEGIARWRAVRAAKAKKEKS
jgi:hypothetical protein